MKENEVILKNIGRGMFLLPPSIRLMPGGTVSYEADQARKLASMYPQLEVLQDVVKKAKEELEKMENGEDKDEDVDKAEPTKAKRGRPRLSHEAAESQPHYEKFEKNLSPNSPV